MYIIKNIVNKKIIIGDLKLIFQQNETKNLHDFFEPFEIENSVHLKHAIKSNYLVILQKDQKEQKPSIEINPHDLKRQIIDELNNQNNGKNSQNDINDVKSKLDALLNAVSNITANQTVINQSKNENVEVSIVDDDKMIDIHTRAVQRLTQNSEASIQAESNIKKSNISENIDELDNLV